MTTNSDINEAKAFLYVIPTFDGSHTKLQTFCKLCNELISIFNIPERPDRMVYLLAGILFKITGHAEIILNQRLEIQTWSQIKNLLHQNLGDCRDLPCLR